jgi:dTDP-4-dehydrorhamnose 3,5-epimerase
LPSKLAARSNPEDLNCVQRIETSLPGVSELRPKVIRDARGFFMETYHRAKFAEVDITDSFVQDNRSCSAKGVLRGLHYQPHHLQAKLCPVVEGEAFDVAVDIRRGSPHFGKCASVLLSPELQNEMYISAGFAHGFLVLGESVQLLYKCSDFCDSSDEHGILWNDSDVNIAWGIADPVVSGKDSKFRKLADVPSELLPRYPGG